MSGRKLPKSRERSGGTYRDELRRKRKAPKPQPKKQVKRDDSTKMRSYFDFYPNTKDREELKCPITGESIYEYIHPSGAKLVYVHKKGCLSSAAAALSYGGDDTHVASEAGTNILSFAGCAHFAEHMMFTGRGGRLERFLSFGADANAYTTPTATVYSFTSETEEGTISAFSELIKMLTHPEFDENQVEKEREIILSELMEDDDVFYDGRKKLVSLLWSRGSVRRDAGGAAKYVRRINADMLRGVYAAAYIPSELVFTLVSGIGFATARAILDTHLLGTPYMPPARHTYCGNIKREGEKRATFSHASGSNVMFVGLSPNTLVDGTEHLYAKRYVYTALLESMLFDRTEPLYLALSRQCEGIYGEFVSDAELRREECILTANLMCEQPSAAADKLLELYTGMLSDGTLFEFKNFENKRRAMAADYLSVIESPAELSLSLAEYKREGDTFVGVAEILINMKKEEFIEWARRALSEKELVFALAVSKKE